LFPASTIKIFILIFFSSKLNSSIIFPKMVPSFSLYTIPVSVKQAVKGSFNSVDWQIAKDLPILIGMPSKKCYYGHNTNLQGIFSIKRVSRNTSRTKFLSVSVVLERINVDSGKGVIMMTLPTFGTNIGFTTDQMIFLCFSIMLSAKYMMLL
jgi:hypothetical protein